MLMLILKGFWMLIPRVWSVRSREHGQLMYYERLLRARYGWHPKGGMMYP